MKKLASMILTAALVAALGATTAFAGEAEAASAEDPTIAVVDTQAETQAAPAQDTSITVVSQDGLVTVTLPANNWLQVINHEDTEVFSEGDCAIVVNVYKADAELPEVRKADDVHPDVYQTYISDKDYVIVITGLCGSDEPIETIKKIVDSISIDKTKITDEMTAHTPIVVEEYTIQDTNYPVWISTDVLNLRDGSSTDNTNVIAGIPYGTKVTVTGSVLHNGEATNWFRVDYNGTVGYCYGEFLSTTEVAPIPTTTPETQPETQPETEGSEYIGYTFSGTDPWGNSITVTLRSIDGDNLEWTITDLFDVGMIYKEKSTPYYSGYTEWYIEGLLDDDGVYAYSYSGNLQLMGGGVQLTFESGEVTSQSEYGGSTSYNVAALADNTCFLSR